MVRVLQNKFFKQALLAAVATVAVLVLCIGFSTVAHAQGVTGVDAGVSAIQQTSGLGTRTFGQIVGQIIHIFLTIVGVIAIILCIYAGFKWMTAGGSEEAVDAAKKTLVNGVIGLIIVFASYAITSFVLNSVGGATGTDVLGTVTTGGNENIQGGGGGLGDFGGSGSSNAFLVKSISPKGATSFANIKITAVLSGSIDESTVNKNNFVVTDGQGVVAGALTVDGDIISFVPSATCPAPNEKYHCFADNAKITVTLKNSITSGVTKKTLQCSATTCVSAFTVGTGVDTDAPTISNVNPHDSDKIPVDQIIPIEALLRDTGGVAFGRIFVDGKIVESFGPSITKTGVVQELPILTKKFNTNRSSFS